MSWDDDQARAGLVGVLEPAFANTNVSVFDWPPLTFNPPAVICQPPASVVKHNPSPPIDTINWTVLGAVSILERSALSGLLQTVDAAVFADPTLGGAVQVTKVVEYRNWRVHSVAGVELLTAELALNTQM